MPFTGVVVADDDEVDVDEEEDEDDEDDEVEVDVLPPPWRREKTLVLDWVIIDEAVTFVDPSPGGEVDDCIGGRARRCELCCVEDRVVCCCFVDSDSVCDSDRECDCECGFSAAGGVVRRCGWGCRCCCC